MSSALTRLEDISNSRVRRVGRAVLVVVLAGLLVLPFVTDDSFLIRIAILAFIWGGYATAWNLFSGYSGYISFGHAVFFAGGGFVSTLLLVEYNISPWIGMIVGGLAVVAAALIIGFVTFRAGLSGIYFALSILAFPLIAAPVIVWLGYIEVSIPLNFDQPYLFMSFRGLLEFYYICFALLLVSVAVTWQMQRRRLGFYLQAIKSSEEAAESLGVNTFRYKMYALSLSAFLSGVLGTLYVQVNYIFATEGIFGVAVSAQPVILAVAGGLGTLLGPLVASFTLFPVAELLRSEYGSVLPGIHNILYGIVLITVIVFFPDGLYAGLRQRILSKPETETETGTEEELPERDDSPAAAERGD